MYFQDREDFKKFLEELPKEKQNEFRDLILAAIIYGVNIMSEELMNKEVATADDNHTKRIRND